MPTVIVIRGLPLSGKTSLGERLSRRLQLLYVDIDTIKKFCVGNTEMNPHASPELLEKDRADMRLAYRILHATVEANLSCGRSLIVGATYSRLAYQEELLAAVARVPGVKVQGIWCYFNDMEEEVARRISVRGFGAGGCNTVEHYLKDKGRYDHTELFSSLKINTSQPFELCLEQALSLFV